MDNGFWFRADCNRQVFKGRLNVWEKVKTVFSVIGAILSVVFFSVLLFLLCRGNINRRRGNGDNERDKLIKDGIGRGQEQADRVTEDIDRAKDSIGRCEEHLQRAENILRNAIKRCRKEKSDT